MRSCVAKGLGSVILLCFSFVSTGCFAGLAALVAGVASIDDDPPAPPDNPPAPPEVRLAARADGDRVVVVYDLFDNEGACIDVDVSWQPLDEKGEALSDDFFPAEEHTEPVSFLDRLVVSDGTKNLCVPAREPTRFEFVWNARPDLTRALGESAAYVRMRLIAKEARRESRPSFSGALVGGNEGPRVLSVASEGTTGFIRLAVTLVDSTSDAVGLSGRYLVVMGDEDEPVGGPVTFEEDVEVLEAVPAGKEHILFWNSVDVLGEEARSVKILLLPHDLEVGVDELGHDFQFPLEEGEGAEVEVFVDNNDDPVVQIIDLANAPDRAFDIPVRFTVIDEEEHPVTVILQWAKEGDDFPALPDNVTDAKSLETLLTGEEPAQVELRRELHIMTQAADVFVTGPVDHSNDLAADEIRATDFVRKGLVYVPPFREASRDLPLPPFGAGSDVFLVGRKIEFLAPGQKDALAGGTVEDFDPRDSVATLSQPIEKPASAMRYRISLNEGVIRLSSGTEASGGVIHSFLWSSLEDISGAGIDPTATIAIRAVGVDSQTGPSSSDEVFVLRSSVLENVKDLAAGNRPISLALGDLNSDERNDIVSANLTDDTIQIYLQTSAGDFPTEPDRTIDTSEGAGGENIGLGPVSVATGDVNGDDLDDVVVANNKPDDKGTYRLIVFTQRDRELALEGFLVTDAEPLSVAVGDVSGDGANDVAAANFLADTVTIYLQEPGSPLSLQFDRRLSTGDGPRSVVLGDVNADGRQDVVVACYNFAPGTVNVFLQHAETGFAETPSFELPVDTPYYAAVGNLGGDTNSAKQDLNDILVADRDNHVVFAFCQSLDGGFSSIPTRALRGGIFPRWLAVGDISGDEQSDVVVTNKLSNSMSVFLRSREEQIAAADCETFPELPTVDFDTGELPGPLVIGDLNADGRQDVAVTNANVSSLMPSVGIYLQNYPGAIFPAPTHSFRTRSNPRSMAVGDLNADGRLDVVVVNSSANPDGEFTASVHLRSKEGVLPETPSIEVVTGPFATSAAVEDVSGDGRSDLIVANGAVDSDADGGLDVYLQSNEGVLPETRSLKLVTSGSAIVFAVGDVNGDGRNDVLAATTGSDAVGHSGVSIFHQQSDGLPEHPSQELVTEPEPNAVAVGDVNDDGRYDVVVGTSPFNALHVFLQSASGVLPETPDQQVPLHVANATGTVENAVDIGDVDGDGRNDIVALGREVFFAQVYLQSEANDFSLDGPDRALSLDGNPKAIMIGDVNNDGLTDVITSTSDPEIEVFIQSPSGLGLRDRSRSGIESKSTISFPSRKLQTDGSPGLIFVGDLNGDGANDIISAIDGNNLLDVHLAH